EGGTLKINNATNFDGELKNLGAITVEQGVTINKKTDDGGNITAPTLTIGGLMKDVIDPDTQQPVQEYISANGSTMGSVTTDKIVFNTLSADGQPHLTLTGELVGKTHADKVAIQIDQFTSKDGVQALINNGEMVYNILALQGSLPTGLSCNELEGEYLQMLLKSGLKMSDFAVVSALGSGLATSYTNAYYEVSNQTLAEATWDTAGETTKIGLDLGTLSNGTLVMLENNMLDKVQSVNVTTDVKLDLAATPNSLDTTVTAPVAVNINGLQGAKKLTIAGSTQTEDTADIVNLNTLGDQFTGTVELTGKVTANMGAAANTAMKGATIVAMGDTVTLGGTLTGGELVVSQDSTANGNLVLANSDVKVVIAADGTTLSNERLAGPIADLDSMGMKSGAEGTVSIGTYDANGNFVKSLAYGKYYTNIRMEGSQVVGDRNTSYYSDALADKATSANGKAGLELADAALVNVNAQADKNSALGNAMDALDAMVATGNTGAADELGAALAGASTAVLGMAVSGDVERQLRAIRNRTTTMGVDQGVVNPEMPYYNAWINAEGGNNELRESGTAGGYKLSSWGGTVGFDVDFTPTFTAGMALTAMYGDLSVKGADQAKGDLDTYYVSAFARYCASAWTHTFVATAGLADMTLNRTVAGSEVEGDTNGLSFGLMYEVGRVFALNEDATACLQPIMNVTWRHTQVSGYTEKGSDLGLKVEDQTYDTITFGAGARLQAVVGESMFNRTSIFECRALIKVDAGDRNGTSEVALAGATAEVESAELGAVGLEAGAGITIPLGDEGSSIFADASIEVRSGYTNVNGTVGYRINF
ncbi:MAG: autotransporter domain-containing protein, partial [Akkermansia sp.]|nr:autotransporter domain-containing protein [Akkermansia sp.]